MYFKTTARAGHKGYKREIYLLVYVWRIERKIEKLDL